MTTLVRAFPVDLATMVDTHSVRGLLVPYGAVADVVDVTEQGVDTYRESFDAGAFMAQVGTGPVARRVDFVDGHDGGLGKVGYALSLTETERGLEGELRVLPRAWEDVASMLADGIDGLSVGFAPVRTERREGVRHRVRAHLLHVALTPVGQYAGALVEHARAVTDTLPDEAAERAAEQAALLAWLDGAEDAQRAYQIER